MPNGVFAGNGGPLGVNLDKAYTPEEMEIFGFRAGTAIDGIDGYSYVFNVAAADINEATSLITGGVLEGQGYWFRGVSQGTGSIADYDAAYPPAAPEPFDPGSVLDPAP